MDPSGMYIHVVDFEGPTRVAGSYMGSTTTWANVARRVKGRLRPLTGDELVIAAQTTQEVTHRFYCSPKKIGSVVRGCRMKFGSRILFVESVKEPDEMNVYKMIELSEKVLVDTNA